MPLTDRHDNPFSTGSRRSVDAYESALEKLHGYGGDTFACIETILAEDPRFVAGHCLHAGARIIVDAPVDAPGLGRGVVEAAERLAAGANDRERGHIAAARAWLDGDCERSLKLYGDVLLRYPRDALALQVAHAGDLYLGYTEMLRDRVARVLPEWDDGFPAYGFILGMHAFGLEETGDLDRAEAVGRRAAAIQPRDAWAVHAVAHVLEMRGQPEDGIEWLVRTSPGWAEQSLLAHHNWWHLALFHLERCETDRALEIYDTRFRPGSPNTMRDLLDASSLLWRLHLCGVDLGSRPPEIASAWGPHVGRSGYVLNDVHSMMALILAGRESETGRLHDLLERRAGAGGNDGVTVREVGLPTCRALMAFGRRAWRHALDGLLAVAPRTPRLGGGHPQRDVLALTALEAALRAGEASVARALAAQRCDRKPFSLANHRLQTRALRCGTATPTRAAVAGSVDPARAPQRTAHRSRNASSRSLNTGLSK